MKLRHQGCIAKPKTLLQFVSAQFFFVPQSWLCCLRLPRWWKWYLGEGCYRADCQLRTPTLIFLNSIHSHCAMIFWYDKIGHHAILNQLVYQVFNEPLWLSRIERRYVRYAFNICAAQNFFHRPITHWRRLQWSDLSRNASIYACRIAYNNNRDLQMRAWDWLNPTFEPFCSFCKQITNSFFHIFTFDWPKMQHEMFNWFFKRSNTNSEQRKIVLCLP